MTYLEQILEERSKRAVHYSPDLPPYRLKPMADNIDHLARAIWGLTDKRAAANDILNATVAAGEQYVAESRAYVLPWGGWCTGDIMSAAMWYLEHRKRGLPVHLPAYWSEEWVRHVGETHLLVADFMREQEDQSVMADEWGD